MTLGFTIFYLSLIVLIPLSATFIETSRIGWHEFWRIVTTARALASYELSFGAALIGALVNFVLGTLVAWVLVRYQFAGKRILDSLVDLPFALPTAVAGIALTTLYATTGWFGKPLAALGVHVAFTRLGIVVALTFIGLPFVVRTVQPVLEDLDKELEEVADEFGSQSPANVRASPLPRNLSSGPYGIRVSLRSRCRGIRIGDLHCRQHADEDGDHTAFDRNQARGVRLRGRDGDCGRHATALVRHARRNQYAAALERPQ